MNTNNATANICIVVFQFFCEHKFLFHLGKYTRREITGSCGMGKSIGIF